MFETALAVRLEIVDVPPIFNVPPFALVNVPLPESAALMVTVPEFEAVPVTESVS